jgi:tetratricopeptide (TPR) repeat protein
MPFHSSQCTSDRVSIPKLQKKSPLTAHLSASASESSNYQISKPLPPYSPLPQEWKPNDHPLMKKFQQPLIDSSPSSSESSAERATIQRSTSDPQTLDDSEQQSTAETTELTVTQIPLVEMTVQRGECGVDMTCPNDLMAEEFLDQAINSLTETTNHINDLLSVFDSIKEAFDNFKKIVDRRTSMSGKALALNAIGVTYSLTYLAAKGIAYVTWNLAEDPERAKELMEQFNEAVPPSLASAILSPTPILRAGHDFIKNVKALKDALKDLKSINNKEDYVKQLSLIRNLINACKDLVESISEVIPIVKELKKDSIDLTIKQLDKNLKLFEKANAVNPASKIDDSQSEDSGNEPLNPLYESLRQSSFGQFFD